MVSGCNQTTETILAADTIIWKSGLRLFAKAIWNNIEYIYQRKIAVEMYKIIQGKDEHRLGRMYTTKCNTRKDIRDKKVEI